MVDRVILTGFMCSGKTSVGRLLAERLGWDFVDFDEWAERREGHSIADLFRERGERYFRALESRLTHEIADRRRIVLAPGGGWVTQPALVARLRPHSLVVWLRVRPDTVYARWTTGGQPVRPLLEGRDPRRAIAALLEAREPLYARADLWLDTDDRAPTDLVATIAARLTAEARPALDDPAGRANNSPATG